MTMHIEQIRPELTWKLRQQVLYPAETVSQMKMDEDDNGYHFALFYNNYIVAVVSLFPNSSDFQFRKFAVEENMQGKGVGKELLSYIQDFAIAEGAKRIWCNARLSAIGFYSKMGYIQTGEQFSKNSFDYEIMEKIIL
jgi:GNAT superfamily N-acetyltransferase